MIDTNLVIILNFYWDQFTFLRPCKQWSLRNGCVRVCVRVCRTMFINGEIDPWYATPLLEVCCAPPALSCYWLDGWF